MNPVQIYHDLPGMGSRDVVAGSKYIISFLMIGLSQ